VSVTGHAGRHVEIPAERREVEVVLDRRRTVSLTVRLPAGTPRIRLHVLATEEDRRVHASGHDVEGGETTIPVPLPHRLARILCESADGAFRGETEVDGEATSAAVRLAPVPLHPVTLLFVDGAGNPLPDLVVAASFRRPGFWLKESLRTGPDGTASMRVPAGEYRRTSFRLAADDRLVQGPGTAIPRDEPLRVDVASRLQLRFLLDLRRVAEPIDLTRLSAVLVRPGGEEKRLSTGSGRVAGEMATIDLDVPDVPFTIRVRYGDREATWTREDFAGEMPALVVK
jgi:hypothetical protein